MILETQAQLNRTKTQLEAWRVAETAKAEAQANQVKVKADLAEEETIIQGSWQEEMICEAAATKHDASAEKDASRCLQAKRQHDLDMRQKDILKKLAGTGNFNLIGTHGDRLLESMMCGSLKS